MDLALSFNKDIGAFDVSVAGVDLRAEDTLSTAVILSLFTDRQAEPHEVAPGADRRGWWADAFAAVASDQFGSRLWLLEREKQLPATVQRAQRYAREALQWLVDDGLAQAVDIAAFVPRMGWLVLQIGVQLKGDSRRFRFEWNDAAQVWRMAGELQ